MLSTKLTCGHRFYHQFESMAPTDLTWCYRCADYRKPALDSKPNNRQGGRSHMTKETKAIALKRTYAMADSGSSVKEIAEAIGVSTSTITAWLTQR